MADLEKYRAFSKELILSRSKNKYANSTLKKSQSSIMKEIVICRWSRVLKESKNTITP